MASDATTAKIPAFWFFWGTLMKPVNDPGRPSHIQLNGMRATPPAANEA